MEPAIVVRGLEKRFGDVHALDGVDLDIPAGTIYGLVGPNGAGKTTLVRSLVGAVKPDAGTVSVGGIDPHVAPAAVRGIIGYMPQRAVLYADLTARENIEFFLRGHRRHADDSAVDQALEFADLGAFAGRSVSTLSGGVQQRVSLAVALVHRPEILLLDEPTAGVDPELRHIFWRRFRHLAEAGATLLITTHQMDEVVHCDRVAILQRGHALADAAPADLLASGGALVVVTANGDVTEHRVSDLDVDLPLVLRGYDLATVERIEVRTASLEEVILGLVENAAPADAG